MVIVSIPAVLNLLVSPYPQIITEPLCVPPNQNWTPLRTPNSNSKEKTDQNVIIFSLFNILCVPPATCSRTPQGYAYPRLRTADIDNLFYDVLAFTTNGLIRHK